MTLSNLNVLLGAESCTI